MIIILAQSATKFCLMTATEQKDSRPTESCFLGQEQLQLQQPHRWEQRQQQHQYHQQLILVRLLVLRLFLRPFWLKDLLSSVAAAIMLTAMRMAEAPTRHRRRLRRSSWPRSALLPPIQTHTLLPNHTKTALVLTVVVAVLAVAA
jgi:hypothetical protein